MGYRINATATIERGGEQQEQQLEGTGRSIGDAVAATLGQLSGVRLPDQADPFPGGALVALNLAISFAAEEEAGAAAAFKGRLPASLARSTK